ncbi:MAG: sugar transferase [Cyanobacteria bacterium J06642_2]
MQVTSLTIKPVFLVPTTQLPLMSVPPQLDSITYEAFWASCQCFLATHLHLKVLTLDFSQTHFIDSCGIGTLRQVVRAAHANNLKVVAWSVTPRITQILKTTGLDGPISIDDRTRALTNPESYPSISESTQLLHPSVRSLSKRGLDILGALVGLLITTLLFLPIAIAIQLDNPGPVLFSQMRRGLHGRPIRIWKFRSMVTDAEVRKCEIVNQIEGAFFKNDRDPRITRVGHFLRRTSLDELPQFWCVLTGSMSLIGTRPPTEDEVTQYAISDWQRLNVKPGLAGEWQVSGRSSIKTFREVVALDLAYQSKWSLAYDLKLIVKTIAIIFSRRSGAC